MYRSGAWRGFWEQEYFGRQAMEEFELHFRGGRVAGGGIDLIGRFTFAGACDDRTGAVNLVKQYLGRHKVLYGGTPDGEGSIIGTWSMPSFGVAYLGPFRMSPVEDRVTGDEPIHEIVR